MKKTCIIKGCNRTASARGLCANCYSAAKTAMKENKIGWQELENMGLAIKSKS